MLTRSFLPPDQKASVLAYTPMFHSRMFIETPKFRDRHFQPTKGGYASAQAPGSKEDLYLDGNPEIDRPLFVQFCANDPDVLLQAAKHVEPYCDAVDLNLGCPQGIARSGNYGAFLQEDWGLIYKLINTLHKGLSIPVTAKMRCLETKEMTLEYAKTILSAGASIITVHGRQREQKGHKTGLADWDKIKYLRENLPPETVIFANGNILQTADLQQCIDATGVDGVMSAEGNMYDPSIFSDPPPQESEQREYWRARDGKGGYRMDAVFRRYLGIIYKHVLHEPEPERKPLFLPSDLQQDEQDGVNEGAKNISDEEEGPPRKRKKRSKEPRSSNPNLVAMQAHLFHLLRPLVAKHTNVRDALAKTYIGDIKSYENVLAMTEAAVREGLLEYDADPTKYDDTARTAEVPDVDAKEDPYESSVAAVARCKRPYWVCQPYVRPLPKEAVEIGALTLSKKEKEELERDKNETKEVGLEPGGKVEKEVLGDGDAKNGERTEGQPAVVDIPKEGLVCG